MELLVVLERAAGVDLSVADRAGVGAMFADLGRVSAWIEARRVAGVHRLEALPEVRFPDAAIVEATGERSRDAERTVHRAATLRLFGRFDKALEAGELTPAHVDALTNGLAQLPDEKRPLLVADQDRLLDLACRRSAQRFEANVRDTVRRVLSDEDKAARLRRQQRATTANWWANPTTGMVHLRGSFDPETGSELIGRLTSARQQLFPDPDNVPETCPADVVERENHLRGLALATLLLGEDAPGWRPEALIVVDETTRDEGFHDRSIVDVGIDTDLPHEAIVRLANRGRAVKVTMRHGVVTSVDGRTNLDRGRSKRLADLDQRRALRAMYPTCAIPDCPVRFRDCEIHHLDDWKPGGQTNLNRLLPVCDGHHDAVHHRGWTLHLHPTTRYLTVTRPDGTSMTVVPPYKFAA